MLSLLTASIEFAGMILIMHVLLALYVFIKND